MPSSPKVCSSIGTFRAGGKISGAGLFADSCVTCHRSARGLAKGRFSLTLYLSLQQHYVRLAALPNELTHAKLERSLVHGAGRKGRGDATLWWR